MKKLLIVFTCVLVMCGCTTTQNNIKPILDKEKINLEIYYHHFNQKSDDHHDLWLFSYAVYFHDKNIDLNKVKLDIDGVDKFGVIDKKLSKDSKYTTEYFNKKVTSDNETPPNIVKHYIIKNGFKELDITRIKHQVNITCGDESIIIDEFIGTNI